MVDGPALRLQRSPISSHSPWPAAHTLNPLHLSGCPSIPVCLFDAWLQSGRISSAPINSTTSPQIETALRARSLSKHSSTRCCLRPPLHVNGPALLAFCFSLTSLVIDEGTLGLEGGSSLYIYIYIYILQALRSASVFQSRTQYPRLSVQSWTRSPSSISSIGTSGGPCSLPSIASAL